MFKDFTAHRVEQMVERAPFCTINIPKQSSQAQAFCVGRKGYAAKGIILDFDVTDDALKRLTFDVNPVYDTVSNELRYFIVRPSSNNAGYNIVIAHKSLYGLEDKPSTSLGFLKKPKLVYTWLLDTCFIADGEPVSNGYTQSLGGWLMLYKGAKLHTAVFDTPRTGSALATAVSLNGGCTLLGDDVNDAGGYRPDYHGRYYDIRRFLYDKKLSRRA